MKCNFCNKIFCSKSSLTVHQNTTKYCLKLQGKIEEEYNFICEYCSKKFTVKSNLLTHYSVCKEKEINDNLEKLEEKLQKEFKHILKEKEDEINDLKQKVADRYKKTDLAKEFGISRETLYRYIKTP